MRPVSVDVVSVERDGALGYALLLIGDDEVRVKLHPDPEAVALLAGPERAVEREGPGLELLKRHAADRAGHEGGVGLLVTVLVDGYDKSLL